MAIFGASVGAAPPALALSYDRLIIFGDSLSDTGNAGRFSNGPVWVEYMARAIGTAAAPARQGGTNFAVGGAHTGDGPFSLRAQVDHFLTTQPKADLRQGTLAVVYGGSNDVRAAVYGGDGATGVEDSLRALHGILDDLCASGVTEMLVPNLANIGLTPEARRHGPDKAHEARNVAATFNARLEEVLYAVEMRWPVRIHRLDVFGLSEEAARDPGRFGFRDVMTPCQGVSVAIRGCEGHVFWDSVHPTTAAHARLADAALAVLSHAAQR